MYKWVNTYIMYMCVSCSLRDILLNHCGIFLPNIKANNVLLFYLFFTYWCF